MVLTVMSKVRLLAFHLVVVHVRSQGRCGEKRRDALVECLIFE